MKNGRNQIEDRILRDVKNITYPLSSKGDTRGGEWELLSLQESVRSALKEPAILQPLSEEEFDHILAGNGLILGVYVEGELVGARAVLFPAIDEDHLGNDVGIPRSEWPKVVYQEISLVSENVRGNGLQKLLGQLIMEELKSRRDEFKYVCCTVAHTIFQV